MSSNVQIEIEVKLKEEQARAEMAKLMNSMKKLTNAKANNIDIKINVDKGGLAELARVETALKNIKTATKQSEQVMFRPTGSSTSSTDKALISRRQQVTALTRDIAKAERQLDKLGKSGFVDKSQVEGLKNSLAELKGFSLDNLKNMDGGEFAETQADVEKLLSSVKQLDDVRLDGLRNANIDNFADKITADLDKIEAKFKALGKDTSGIDAIRSQLAGLNSVAPDKLPSTFGNIRNQVRGLNNELRQVNVQGSSMGRFFGDLGSTLRTFTLGNIIGDGIVRGIRGATQAFLEMDKAMTDVIKVADENDINSALKLDNIRNQASGIAREVGMASSDVLFGISDAIQQGMGSLDESIAVARSSLMLANVGDMAQEQASSAVSTMVKGFQIDPLREVQKEVSGTTVSTNELTVAMDALNHAGNNYAIGTDGVAEAMKRGGAVLKQYGVSLEDSVGLITASNESIQNPEKVGNGLKSIAINLSGMKANAKDGSLELNKTAMALQDIAGIDVYDDKKTGSVKNMVTILDEVKGKWGELREDEQLALSEAIAGKHQAAIFQSLMGNYDAFNQIRSEFENNDHIGSAERENAKYVDSIAGKLNELKTIWLSIFQTMVTSDFTKGMLDGAIGISQQIENIIKWVDKLGALTPAIVAFGATFASMIKQIKTNSTAMQDPANGVTSMFAPKNNFVSQWAKNYKDMQKSISYMPPLPPAMENSVRRVNPLFASLKDTMKGVGTSAKAMGTAILGTAKNVGSFALSFAGQMIVIMAVVKAMEMAVKAYDDWANAIKNKDKALADERESIKANLKTNNDNLSYLKQTKSSYEDLLKKKQEYSKIPEDKWTENQKADMEQLKTITNELIDRFPELQSGYDIEGNPKIIGNLDDQIRKTKELISLEQERMKGNQAEQAENSKKWFQEGDWSWTKKGLPGKQNFRDHWKELGDDHTVAIKKMQDVEKAYYNDLSTGDLKRAKGKRKQLQEATQAEEQAYQKRIELFTEWKNREADVQTDAMSQIQSGTQWKELGKASLEAQQSVEGIFDKVNFTAPDKVVNAWKGSSEEIAKYAQKNGDVVAKWNEQLGKSQFEYSQTGDLNAYKESISGVAEAISKVTGLDINTVMRGLIPEQTPLNQATQALQKYMSAYGSSIAKLDAGGAEGQLAQSLQRQYEAIQKVNDKFMNLDLDLGKNSDVTKNKQTGKIVVKKEIITDILQDESYPQKLKDVIKAMDKTDGGVTTDEVEIIKKANIAIEEGDVNKLKEVNKELKAMGLKPINIDFNAPVDKMATVEEKLKAIRSGDDRAISIAFDYDGAGELPVYEAIIKNLSASPEVTNSFIVQNEDAINKLKTQEEAIDWLKNHGEVSVSGEGKITWNVEGEEKVEEAGKKVDLVAVDKNANVDIHANSSEIESAEGSVQGLSNTISDADGNEIQVKTNKDDVLSTIKDVETLVKISSEVEDGKYKLEVDATTDNAVQQLGNLEKALEGLNKELSGMNTTASINVNTVPAVGALAILSGKITSTSNLLTRLSSRNVNINTAKASQNITGLNRNIDRYSTKVATITTRNVNINTARSAQNLTGLISKIELYNGTSIKSANVSTNAPTVTKKIQSLINKIKEIPKSKSVTISVKTSFGGFSLGGGGGAPKKKSVQGFAPASFAMPSMKTMAYSESPMAFSSPQPSEMLSRNSELDGLMRASGTISSLTRGTSVFNKASSNLKAGLLRATNPTSILKDGGNIEKALKFSVDLLTELDNRIKMVTSSLSMLDKQMKYATNAQKLKFLQEQNRLYKEQQALLKDREDILVRQRNNYKSQLGKKGFSFTNDGNFKNYEEKLIKLEEELDKKDKALKKANDGKNEGAKKKAQETYDKAKEELEEIKKLTSEYTKVALDELPKAKEEWVDLANSIKDAEREQRKITDEIKQTGIDAYYTSLNKQVTQYKNRLEEIDVLLKNAHGSQKKMLLEERQDILSKQKHQQGRVRGEYVKEMANAQKYLKTQGFEFRENGDIINYIQHLEKLKAQSDDFEYISEKAEKYLDLLTSKIPSVDKEILELDNSIFEVAWDLMAINREIGLFGTNTKLKELEIQFDKLNDKIALYDVQMKHAYGEDKLNLMKKKIDALKEQNDLQEDNIASYKQMLKTYQSDLGSFGFAFNGDGDITNLSEIYGKYRDNENFSKVKELVEEYLDIQNDKLPDAVKEWESLSSAIKDAYKEQLNITKEAEDKVTEIYKKQVEERKKLIEDELKAKTDALNKEKEAYNKMREEAKYKDNHEEQLDKVAELQKKYDIAKKDTSLGGQKKMQDILKQLEEEQKKLKEMVADKLDSDINDMYDKENERLEEDAEKKKDSLDEMFSDDKIKELVKEALSTGIFTDIDGQVKSLQDVMMDFLDKYDDGMSAIGGIMKEEWIGNLAIAKDTMSDIYDITKKITSGSGLFNVGESEDDSKITSIWKDFSKGLSQASNKGKVEVAFNAPLFVVEGDADTSVVEELKGLANNIKDQVIDEIVRNIR